ncbi:iron complex outermembrane recepter protein [Spirosomataceae bacterium TFI 002]|nr:iron complex outermembrane recepter protein [Spirosomataceae bacterium TFI 002]
MSQNIDSSEIAIDTIFVKAFEQNRSKVEVASPIQVIDAKAIQRFDNQGLVPILNQYPGIRMEERSPGSYRLSIRGSSLRSPFGVRNVKVYWNEIPLTDGNGITYFNFLDINTVESLEILKGPSGSMYGAGMGGVVLLKSNDAKPINGSNNSINANFLVGGFGTLNTSINLQNASDKVNSTLSYAKSKFGGYRDHSKMDREVLNWRSSFFLNDKFTLSVNTMYANLEYQTPLGLTDSLSKANPRQARPGNRFVPGAVEQNAGIKQKILLIGLSQEFRPVKNWKTTFSLFGNKTQLENPFINNYEFRDERSFGLRLINNWDHSIAGAKARLNFGFEAQSTASTFDVYDNNKGEKGENQSLEEVTASQGVAFLQYDVELAQSWFLTAGLSLNTQKYVYTNLNQVPVNEVPSDFETPLIPRISILKKVKNTSVYLAVANGFSPPTVAEYVTATKNILQAEKATNVEFGLKHQSTNRRLYAELSFYNQNLKNAIVREFDANEIQVFVNKGGIRQNGLEAFLSYKPIKLIKFFTSLNLIDYQFVDYKDLENDFSGNNIPSVANTNFTAGVDFDLTQGFFLNSNFSYTGDVPLNNANTVYADSFWLLDARLGWSKNWNRFRSKLFVGGNNLTNATYGSGNDVNAFGDRFFNPSPTRYFNTGLSLSYSF